MKLGQRRPPKPWSAGRIAVKRIVNELKALVPSRQRILAAASRTTQEVYVVLGNAGDLKLGCDSDPILPILGVVE